MITIGDRVNCIFFVSIFMWSLSRVWCGLVEHEFFIIEQHQSGAESISIEYVYYFSVERVMRCNHKRLFMP